MFCTRLDEAVIQRQEVVQPLPITQIHLVGSAQQKGGGKKVTAPQGFLINPPLLNILHNDIMHYIIISSDVIIKCTRVLLKWQGTPKIHFYTCNSVPVFLIIDKNLK